MSPDTSLVSRFCPLSLTEHQYGSSVKPVHISYKAPQTRAEPSLVKPVHISYKVPHSRTEPSLVKPVHISYKAPHSRTEPSLVNRNIYLSAFP